VGAEAGIAIDQISTAGRELRGAGAIFTYFARKMVPAFLGFPGNAPPQYFLILDDLLLCSPEDVLDRSMRFFEILPGLVGSWLTGPVGHRPVVIYQVGLNCRIEEGSC